MDAATPPLGAAAPEGAVISPAPTPPACATDLAPHADGGTGIGRVVSLRSFLAQQGIEIVDMGGAMGGLSPDDLEVYGMAPAGADGKPDMMRVTEL